MSSYGGCRPMGGRVCWAPEQVTASCGAAAALALMLALVGAGCQTGARSPGPGGGVATLAPASVVPVPAPTGGGTYSAFCGAPPGCPGGGVPAALRRPMHLP